MGYTDMADNFLFDFITNTRRFDNLDRLTRAIGGIFNTDKHEEIIEQSQTKSSIKNKLGTTKPKSTNTKQTNGENSVLDMC